MTLYCVACSFPWQDSSVVPPSLHRRQAPRVRDSSSSVGLPTNQPNSMAMRTVFSPSSLISFRNTTTATTAAYSVRLPNFPLALSWRRRSSLLFNIPTAASPIVRRRVRRGRLSPGVAYSAASVSGKSIHDFTVQDIDGKDISLSKFKGKVLLVVNVASRCGLTSSNYSELSHLYEKYKSQGFEILAFPCNQFGGQEPGTNPQIKEFACTRFKAEFPIFDKVDVNGPNTAPVYQYLKSSTGGFLGDLIKWNFEKFLVNGEGKVVERYSPTTSPFQIEKDIKKLLAA